MLVHKSLDIRPEVWKRLRINAELSDVPLRDYLAWLIEHSSPVDPENAVHRQELEAVAQRNREAREQADHTEGK